LNRGRYQIKENIIDNHRQIGTVALNKFQKEVSIIHNKLIRYMFILMIIISLFAVIFLSGCSKPECETSNDCNDHLDCTRDRCNSEGICVHQNIPGCTCGDGYCDSATENGYPKEDGCNCAADCPPCSGSEGSYLEKYCESKNNRQVCVKGIPPEKVKTKQLTDTIDTRLFKLLATYSFEEPFDLSRSTFNVRIKLDSISDSVKEPKITKIQLFEKLDRRGIELNILGEEEINQILWSPESEISSNIIITNGPKNASGVKKKVSIRFYYEYKSSQRGKDVVTKSTYEKELSSDIIFIDPGTERSCPEDCDDNNKCTIDYCAESTNFFCKHKVITRPCCGNHICDDNENTCTCPADCGTCEKLVGQFIEYGCFEDECVTMLRDPEAVQPKTVIDDKSWGGRDFQVQVKTTYNEPFSLKDDNFYFTLELINMKEGTRDIKIKRFQMLDKNELLGEKDVSLPLLSIGSLQENTLSMNFAKNIPDEEKKVLTLKIFYDYQPPPDSRGNPVPKQINQVYTISYGSITFINPAVT